MEAQLSKTSASCGSTLKCLSSGVFLYYRHNFILILYSKCQICSLLATTAASTLEQTSLSLLRCCLSRLPTQPRPCILSGPSPCSTHPCRSTPLLGITENLTTTLRIKFRVFTMALKAEHNLMPVDLLCPVQVSIQLSASRPQAFHSSKSGAFADHGALNLLLPRECFSPSPHHTPPPLSP